jgi:hypothetical protein
MLYPKIEDLVIYQGASFFYTFTWEQGDENVPSSLEPVDLTDYEAYMQIKTKFDDTEPLCSVDTLTQDEITLDTDTGEVRVRIPPQKTAALPWKKVLIYDIKLYNKITLDAYRLRYGTVRILPEVSKTTFS